jgi:3-oxoacyl-[acyl-carrier protein] reductase
MTRQHTALVTNALEFAGPPAVTALLEAGLRVLAHDRRFATSTGRKEFERRNPGATALPDQEPEPLVAAATLDGAGLDVLVSNDAYPAIHGSIEELDAAAMRETLDALVLWPLRLARAAIPALRSAAGARVVMVTSCRTRLPRHDGAVPDAARAAGNALVKSLSLELAPHGIPVNAIAPNFLASETYYPRARFVDDPAGRAWIEQTVPVRRLGEPGEVGELIRFLATMKGSFLTGAIIDFSGGWPAASPFVP